MKKADCPVCDALLELDDKVVSGELIECQDCGAELEVIKTNPVKLREAPQEEEDWGQ
ncbi:MAG: lysine biosynthesis protein LysW [Ignavibacteriae bacterium HGW-Ignavibacteriae-2]|jgi:alpha-aminoadipate carrier protein LysW|nr:lysine biosynthesis protein LysW [Bacteroidota bacterium]PKL88981.1 MAG: lysine biosynthesis protein LysW [Ignavibacteriae bacterium HGW-Ignavibacteriae-2]